MTGLDVEAMNAVAVHIGMRLPEAAIWERDALLIRGEKGWGEYSPLPGYPSQPEVCLAAAEEASSRAWPRPVRPRVPVNELIPSVDPVRAALFATAARQRGALCVKVKVGVGDDLSRLAAVRDALGWKIALRVDANGKWDLEEAARMIAKMARYDIELVEQPVAGLRDLAALRRRVSVPLAADESIRCLADARELAERQAADVIVLKTQPLGGVWPALELAEAAAVPAIVTSMFETSIGLAAGLALAACLPELPYACGLGTASFLSGDVVADPLIADNGWLDVRRPEPDEAFLARYRAAAMP